MKRIALLFLFVFVLMINVQQALAYEPGLLYGKTFAGDGTTKDLQHITDNDATTFSRIYYNVSYTFPNPVNLSAMYYNITAEGNFTPTNSHISFLREDGSSIRRINLSSAANKVRTPIEIFQVKKIVYSNGDGFFDYIYDFEVYKETDITPPSDPQNVTASGLDESKIKISWLPPTDADFNRVHVYINGTRIAVVPKSQTTTTIAGLQAETEYSFIVRAVDEDGNESVGVPVTSRTLEPPPTEPPPPGSVRIELDGAATYTTANLKFQASRSSAIKLYRDGQEIAKLPGNATTHKDGALQPGKSYKYWIVAENAIGTTASATITVNTPELPKPSQVKISVKTLNDSSVELAFGALDAESIKLYRDDKEIAALPGSAISYLDSGVQAGNKYRYWIVAINPRGTAASAIIEVMTPGGKIKNLRVAEQKTDRIKIAWDADPLAEKYIVEVVITHSKTASLGISDIASAPPEERKEFETTNTFAEIENVSPGDKLSFFVSGYKTALGKFGTSSIGASVPIFDTPSKEGLPTANDVVDSSFSLAFNFWVFFLIGAALLVSPWLFQVARSSLGKKRQEPEESPRRAARELRRKIRMDLRGE